jgi:hypothetical protein
MRPLPLVPLLVAALTFAATAHSADGQSTNVPTVSGRYFNGGGSVKVLVKGSFQIDTEIPINKPASFGDGEMTWIQYGVSGAADPNVLITFQPGEMGIIIGRGKSTANAGSENCKGKAEVTASVVSGQFTCPGITSYDPSTGRMGKVDIEIRFTAKS